MRFRVRGDSFPHARGHREIARQSWQDWIGVAHVRDGAVWTQAGQEIVAPAGDLIVTDMTVPFKARFQRRMATDLWMFPRRLIVPHIPSGHIPSTLLVTRTAGGINRVVHGYLTGLGEAINSLADDERAAVVDNFCRLLAIAYGAAAGDHPDAARDAWLRRIRRHICANLTEPGLSPASVAEANRLSVRQLHRLFETSELSFSRYVLARRLDAVRAALIDPAHAGRTVSEIALTWGFNSLATFHRQFRSAYGMTPGDLRASAP